MVPTDRRQLLLGLAHHGINLFGAGPHPMRVQGLRNLDADLVRSCRQFSPSRLEFTFQADDQDGLPVRTPVRGRGRLLLRRVGHVQDDVRDAGPVEVIRLSWQVQMPPAHCAETFEGQVALVVEIDFELAAVIDGSTRGNGTGDDVLEHRRAVLLPGIDVFPDRVARQGKLTVDIGIWPLLC